MRRLLRWCALVVVVAVVVSGVRRRRMATAGPPSWPSFDPAPGSPGTPTPAATGVDTTADIATAGTTTAPTVAEAPPSTRAEPAGPGAPPRWVVPVDGVPPVGFPLKANDSSMIFHAPGGRFYDRTRAHRCYADAADAIADGYRAAKA